MRIVIYPSNDAIIFSTQQLETKKLLDLFHIPLVRYGDLDISELFTVGKQVSFLHERGFSYTIYSGTELEVFPNRQKANPCACGKPHHAGGLCYTCYINQYNHRRRHGIDTAYRKLRAVV